MKTKLQLSHLTPALAVKARESLNLSQAKVAADTGLSRPYLSQFEGGKRVLEDTWLDALQSYYISKGWEPKPEEKAKTPEEHLQSPDHNLTIMDGFVVAPDATADNVVEELLEEYYKNSEQIKQLREVEFKRGIFGGFIEEEAIKASLRPLALMARQFEIKEILHGQDADSDYSLHPNASAEEVKTVGQYIQLLITNATTKKE